MPAARKYATSQFFSSILLVDRQTNTQLKNNIENVHLYFLKCTYFHFTIKKVCKAKYNIQMIQTTFFLTQCLSLQKLFFFNVSLFIRTRLTEPTSSPSSNIQQWDDHFKCISAKQLLCFTWMKQQGNASKVTDYKCLTPIPAFLSALPDKC